MYMNFISDTFKYYFKNFFKLLLVFLPATVFFVLLVSPISKIEFIYSLKTATINNFWDCFKVFFPYGFLSVVYLILFAILFALSFAVFTALSEYHLRTGKHNIKESIRLIPSYILPCLVVCFILMLVSIFINFCFSAICYFAYKLIVVNKVINLNIVVVAGIVYGLLNLIYVIVGSYLLYTSNHIMLNKSTMAESLGLTALNFDKKYFIYLCSFLFPALILVPMHIFTPHVWWANIIYIIGFTLSFMYIAVLNLTSFYKINNLERNDLKKYPYTFFK